jgi:hypothetical protein
MSDAKRILTVSYGTFSCTLEGFADPLGTLRDVTDHFRNLVAEDPNFGAVPEAKRRDTLAEPLTGADEDWHRSMARKSRRSEPAASGSTNPAPQTRPLTKAAEVSVNRLINTTDSALDDPETQRRRAAMAQLKAVVLAQIAERQIRDDHTAMAGNRRSAFQQDLDQSPPPAPLSAQRARRRGPALG